ncbi:MAG TPA: cytochrome bc complex cytochrome b subunit [Thiobacillaceae bacterium]|nr:cytochrome bc complex cytochrome b subunit [Thiobacillaceae bacterium]
MANTQGTTGLRGWIDERFPLTQLWREHVGEYFAPPNFNFFYIFGVLSLVVLINQLLTGLWLTMNYKPAADLAFGSVEYIMRDVKWGWLIRYMHSTGASAFFIVVYLHMFRGLMYGSYKSPRELVWLIGMLIFLCLMAESFFGYLLPWGQMSYWGAQVIISLFGAIPGIGDDLTLWIRGDYVVSDATLNRFFALHVIAIPLALLGLVVAHVIALHHVGSNNPEGVEIKKYMDEKGKPLDGIPFHPYYTVKDIVGVIVFLFFAAFVIFFWPDGGGYFLEHPNFEPADPLKTPPHIAPVWYFTPFYAVLRAVPPLFGSQFPGVVMMGIAVLIFAALPWIDNSPVKSIRYRGPTYKLFLAAFVLAFIGLGWLGVLPAEPTLTWLARILTVIYLGFFYALPWYSKAGRKPILGPLQNAFIIAIIALGVGIIWGSTRAISDGKLSMMFLLYTACFALMPFYLASDKTKPEPERVTG